MNLLVTGGAGFIGSHLLQILARRSDIKTIVYDNMSSGLWKHVPDSIEVIRGDVREGGLGSIFSVGRFDAVIHLAAQTMVPYSLAHPDEDCSVNLRGLINVLECCRRFGVKHVTFSSSAAVYGDNGNVPLRETEPPLPTSFYGLTKFASEHYLRLYHDLYGINATVLRFANVYGERQGAGGEGGVVSIFCRLLAQGKGVTVFGDGRQTRDFVYAGDVAEALLRSVQLKGYNIINVSTQQETSLNRLLDAFRKAVGRDFEVSYGPAREGDIFRSVLDNTRCRQLLDFCPSMELERGISLTYADYLRQQADA